MADRIVSIARYGRHFGFAQDGAKEVAPCVLEMIEGEMVARVYGTNRILTVNGFDGSEFEFRRYKRRQAIRRKIEARAQKSAPRPVFGATPEEIARYNVETATVAPKAVPTAKGGWITDPKTGKRIRSSPAARVAIALGAKLEK